MAKAKQSLAEKLVSRFGVFISEPEYAFKEYQDFCNSFESAAERDECAFLHMQEVDAFIISLLRAPTYAARWEFAHAPALLRCLTIDRFEKVRVFYERMGKEKASLTIFSLNSGPDQQLAAALLIDWYLIATARTEDARNNRSPALKRASHNGKSPGGTLPGDASCARSPSGQAGEG